MVLGAARERQECGKAILWTSYLEHHRNQAERINRIVQIVQQKGERIIVTSRHSIKITLDNCIFDMEEKEVIAAS